MNYRMVLQAKIEMVQDQELSANRRLKEAVVLYAYGKYHTAIYIAGLSAEMYLKSACFFLDGALPADPVGPRIAPAAIKKGRLHDLLFWSGELSRLRSQKGLAPAPNALLSVVASLYDDWFIEMRYRPGSATDSDAAEFIERVEWLAANYNRLRR
jgi:hypothetical protein